MLLSTHIAYSGRGLGAEMVLGRAGLGLVVAAAAGFVIARSILLVAERIEAVEAPKKRYINGG